MTKKVVIANFKMNKTIRDTKEYIAELIPLLTTDKVLVGICPPFTAIKSAERKLKATNILLGAQNMHVEDKGAYTGEVSGEMVKEAGANFVILGHSERRNIYKENNVLINKKIKKALKLGIRIVLCIGESLAERGQNKTETVINVQLSEALKDVYANEMGNIIIAYEPVWAIGTGKVPTNEQIAQAMQNIKDTIKKLYNSEIANSTKILYGGSVNENNSKEIATIKGVDGALIGGASLDAKKFAKIIANCS